MEWSVRLADSIIKTYQSADDYPYQSWSYPQGFMLWGMIHLYEAVNDQKYLSYILEYADKHVDARGRVIRFHGKSLDDIMTGSILPWVYKQTGEERYKIASGRIKSAFETYPRNSDMGFWHSVNLPGQMWVDGVFMGQMFLISYGHYIGESEACFSEAARQLQVIYKNCSKNNSGLILHAYSEELKVPWADPKSGCSPEVWSEGLGWYALILAKVLEYMPRTQHHREDLLQQYRQLLNSLKEYRDSSGLWFQVVDKGFMKENWTDASGSAMILYSIQKAIQMGVVAKEEFQWIVDKGYNGLLEKISVQPDETLVIRDACQGLCVQDSYEAYIRYPKTENAQEAVAAYLWALGLLEQANDK